jgi:hypothetical protein
MEVRIQEYGLHHAALSGVRRNLIYQGIPKKKEKCLSFFLISSLF